MAFACEVFGQIFAICLFVLLFTRCCESTPVMLSVWGTIFFAFFARILDAKAFYIIPLPNGVFIPTASFLFIFRSLTFTVFLTFFIVALFFVIQIIYSPSRVLLSSAVETFLSLQFSFFLFVPILIISIKSLGYRSILTYLKLVFLLTSIGLYPFFQEAYVSALGYRISLMTSVFFY